MTAIPTEICDRADKLAIVAHHVMCLAHLLDARLDDLVTPARSDTVLSLDLELIDYLRSLLVAEAEDVDLIATALNEEIHAHRRAAKARR